MTGPEHMDYEALSRDTLAALENFDATAQRLAKAEVTGRSRDGRVMVRVNAAGDLTAIRLRGGILQRSSAAALGEVVTKTIRAAQDRARAAYEQELERLTPPEVAESNRVIREALDRAEIID